MYVFKEIEQTLAMFVPINTCYYSYRDLHWREVVPTQLLHTGKDCMNVSSLVKCTFVRTRCYVDSVPVDIYLRVIYTKYS